MPWPKRRVLAATAAAFALGVPGTAEAMFGGEPQDPGPPWAVRMDSSDGWRCSASRITPRWIITAAHCLLHLEDGSARSAGEIALTMRTNGSQTVVTPEAAYAHPSFNFANPRSIGYDVGLVKLSQQAASALPGPVLPLASVDDIKNLRGRGVTLFAFGALEDRDPDIPYKSPDHAWGFSKKISTPSATGLSMLLFERWNTRSEVRGGDSGGAWVGWQRGGWRLLSVVSSWVPGGKAKQRGVQLRKHEIFSWLSETVRNR